MALVGHDRAHSSHATQRLKSMTGNPNDGGASDDCVSVSTPVFRLFAMILSMCLRRLLPVVSGIREVETLIDHRKIRHDVVVERAGERGPVEEG